MKGLKRIAVLGTPDSWYFRDLQRAAGNDFEIHSFSFSSISAHVGASVSATNQDGDHQSLDQFDATIVRTMPPGSTEEIVFRMDALGAHYRNGGVVINSPRSLEAAIDKYLSLQRLAEAEIPIPRTIACQTVEQAMNAFHDLGRRTVVKPLFGGEGRGITFVDDEDIALRVFKTLSQMNLVIYLQEFIPHEGFDLRILVIGDQTFCIKRENKNDWRTNISRGATAARVSPPKSTIELAVRAAKTLGVDVAGVDILTAPSEQPVVIEVNAVPGWMGLAKTLEIDIARSVLEYCDQVTRTAYTPSSSDDEYQPQHPSVTE
ncbi:MAG: RimK family alpha-L-glutamate ligase [Pirellulaceae bacterium]